MKMGRDDRSKGSVRLARGLRGPVSSLLGLRGVGATLAVSSLLVGTSGCASLGQDDGGDGAPAVGSVAEGINLGFQDPAYGYTGVGSITVGDLQTGQQTGRYRVCTGTLISSRYVLTAAHCFKTAAAERVNAFETGST